MSVKDVWSVVVLGQLLAVDGGGIRGVLTLEILATIEQQLRARDRRPDLVLADFFD
jgi:uncharacterized protein